LIKKELVPMTAKAEMNFDGLQPGTVAPELEKDKSESKLEVVVEETSGPKMVTQDGSADSAGPPSNS
jgi:hypothetical protein